LTPKARAALLAAASFIDRGRPDGELAVDDTCPKTTAEDWQDAERVNIQIGRRR
jgi:hypothetical protein